MGVLFTFVGIYIIYVYLQIQVVSFGPRGTQALRLKYGLEVYLGTGKIFLKFSPVRNFYLQQLKIQVYMP